MKKVVWLTLSFLIILFIAATVAAVIIAFKIIRPTTESINQNLALDLSRIVRIPQGILPPVQNFYETIYFWEMETNDREVVAVRFKHTTGFVKEQDKIEATLEMVERGDPSIFVKVLPAIVTDEQSLKSAVDPQKANLAENDQALYQSLKLSVTPTSGQTVKIVWEYDKSTFSKNTSLYQTLNKFPQPLLEFLYNLPRFVIDLLGS